MTWTLIAAAARIRPELLHDERVKEADLRILLDERAVLLAPGPRRWPIEETHEPLGVTPLCLPPATAGLVWLDTYHHLQRQRQGVEP